MGVDTAIYIGWGKALPKFNLLETVISGFDDDRYEAGWEFFKEHYPLLELIEVGNYMSGVTEHVITIKRITDSFDTYDIPGGVLSGPDNPNDAELFQFREAYQVFSGDAKEPESFVAVLWH